MAEGNTGGGGRRIGSVKAAINMYGQRATRTVSPQLDLPEAKVRIQINSFIYNCAKNGLLLAKVLIFRCIICSLFC